MYQLWTNAYSIRSYGCKSDENIIIYSHRTSGWSTVYQLTPNFSVEVLTNFDMVGRLFYVKI